MPYITPKEFDHLWEKGTGRGLSRALCNTDPVGNCSICPLGNNKGIPGAIRRGQGLCGIIVLRGSKAKKENVYRLLKRWIKEMNYEDI